jgi:hypothetical protein
MGLGVPSRAPIRDSARPIVHTATAGKPSSFICKQSNSRVQVGRCHPKSCGVRPSKRTSTRSNRSSVLRAPLSRRRSYSPATPSARNRLAAPTTVEVAISNAAATCRALLRVPSRATA